MTEGPAVAAGADHSVPADPGTRAGFGGVPGHTGLTRRALLTGAAALPLVLTACKGVQALGTPPPPAADVRVLRAAISAEQLMVARCAAAAAQMQRVPAAQRTHGQTAVLAAVAAVQSEHTAHLAQLRSRLVEPAGARTTPGPVPPVPLPVSAGGLLSALQQAEQNASDRLLGQLGGLPASLAQLLASIAAAEATHVPFLQAAGAQ